MTNTTLFEANLNFLKEKFPQLYELSSSHINTASLQYDLSEDLLKYNGQSILHPLNTLTAELLVQMQPSFKGRIHTPRFSSSTDSILNSELKEDIIESYGTPLTNSAPVLKQNIYKKYGSLSAPKIHDAMILGSLMAAPFYNLLSSDPLPLSQYSSLTLVEDTISNFLVSLHLFPFQDLIEKLKNNNIAFRLIIEANEYSLRENVCNSFVVDNPSAFMGLKVFVAPYPTSGLRRLRSYLFNHAGLGQRILGFLGNSTDEVNQTISIVSNIKNPTSSYKQLRHFPRDHESPPVFLCASGPSLDTQLDTILEYQGKAVVVACGSAIKTLMAANIIPDIVICLERGKSLTDDFLKLRSEGFNPFEKTILVGSYSLDSELVNLFTSVILFHRPLASLTSLISDSKECILPMAGPEVVNAGLEASIALGFKNIICFGVDFGTSERTSYRSNNALGESPRDLSEAMESNKNGTIFTEPGFVLSRDAFEHAIRLYADVNVYRLGEGLIVKHTKNIDSSDILNYIDTNNSPSTYLSELYGKLPSSSSDSSRKEIAKIKDAVLKSIKNLSGKYLSKDVLLNLSTSSNQYWSSNYTKHFSSLLRMPTSENKGPESVAISIMRQYIFMCSQTLYDFEGEKNQYDDLLSLYELSISKGCDVVAQVIEEQC